MMNLPEIKRRPKIITNIIKSIGSIVNSILIAYHVIFSRKERLPPRVRVLVTYKGNLLLVKNIVGNHRWTLPGGGVKYFENEIDAVKREVKEEVGLELKDERIRHGALLRGGDIAHPYDLSCYTYEMSDEIVGHVIVLGADILDAQWLRVDSVRSSDEVDEYIKTLLVYDK